MYSYDDKWRLVRWAKGGAKWAVVFLAKRFNFFMLSEAIVHTAVLSVFNLVFFLSRDAYVQTPMKTEQTWNCTDPVADNGIYCSFSRVQTIEL
jgi:hypothetical protein